MCQLGFKQYFKEKVQISNLQCQRSSVVCPMTINEFRFPFINEYFIAHPSVNFVYYINRSFDESIVPDFICYNATKCRHLFTPTIEKFDCSCNPWSEIMGNQSYQRGEWDFLIYAVRRIFSGCYLAPKNLTSMGSHVFNCGDSSPLIPKHRLHDGYIDCANSEDESFEFNSCALALANRFQCKKTINRCIPRVLLSNKIINCPDASDEASFFECAQHEDYGCRWKRGSLIVIAQFSFYQICDGFIDAIEGNNTDETNCPHDWTHECNSLWTRCNSYWQCRNGRDELNCNEFDLKWPNLPSCIAQQQFYCVNQTSRQLECYSNALAGNDWEDCVGGVDERVGGFCQKT